jgi:hemoglobin-like flavoprotein
MTDIQLIADNFALISEKTDNLAAVFYQRFFGKHPELEDLFTNNPAPQQQMLNETLTAVVDHLEDAGWVKTNMEALGLRHQSYEISDEMYDWWIDVLIETLCELSGEAWNERLERVWRKQLETICGFARHARFATL